MQRNHMLQLPQHPRHRRYRAFQLSREPSLVEVTSRVFISNAQVGGKALMMQGRFAWIPLEAHPWNPAPECPTLEFKHKVSCKLVAVGLHKWIGHIGFALPSL